MGQPNPQKREPRRHHYIPQCWLSGFTESGETGGRLWVTDFSRQNQWPSTPDKAGHRRDFYRLSDQAPDPTVVERFFSKLETGVAPILRSIDRERRWPNNDELDALLCFMAYQAVRVPSFRSFLLGISDGLAHENLAKKLKSPETWAAALKGGIATDVPGAGYETVKKAFESGEFETKAETIWYMQMAFPQAKRVHQWLRRRHWLMSVSSQGRLIASDNPVALETNGKTAGFSTAKFVVYPVSRHALLVGAIERRARPMENFKYFAGTNTLMLVRADAQVYSHASDFSWLDENRKSQTEWRLFSKSRFLRKR